MNTNNKYNTNSARPVSDFPVSDSQLPDVTLMAAFEEAYLDCLRKKSMTASALRFRVDEAVELTRLALEVERGEYVPLPSRAFIVHRPVPREIIAARFRDRIAEHYIVMRLKPLAERTLPDGAYSCRDGRGNLAAVFRLRDELRRASEGYTRPCWAARYDLRAFFMSIDRRRLYEDFVRLIEDGYDGYDRDILLYLTRVITLTCPADRAVRRCPRWEWDSVERGKSVWDLPWYAGLAIGNLPSQLGANVENAPHLRLLEDVGMPATNYVDDFAHAVTDREAFLAMTSYIRGWLKEERGLTLHPRKFYLQPADRGVKFLGCVVKGDRVYIGNRVVHSLLAKVRWHNRVLGTSAALRRRHAERFANLLNSYLGLMRHFRTYNIRRRVAEEVLAVWSDCISFSADCARAVAAPRCRRLERSRHRAKREHREDLSFLKTNML